MQFYLLTLIEFNLLERKCIGNVSFEFWNLGLVPLSILIEEVYDGLRVKFDTKHGYLIKNKKASSASLLWKNYICRFKKYGYYKLKGSFCYIYVCM